MEVVIIGGGIGGLVCAAGLSKLARRVTIIEKDAAPSSTRPRRYAPQGAHIHILLQAGLNIVEELLPGFRQQLINGGSAQINAGSGQQIFEYGAWRPTRELGLVYLGQSRLHFETLLHQRVSALPNVEFVRDTASSLHIENGQVCGVKLKSSNELFSTSLVIDASGIGSSFSKQLQKQGLAEIPIQTMPINIFYSTIHFQKPDTLAGQKENILIVPEAGVSNLGGSLLDIEHNRWCISLHGRAGHPVPNTIEQWCDAIRGLPDSRIWDRIKNAQPLNEINQFKKADAVWRRFDQCQQLPAGYLPLGDAINSLNPIFGQGMTVTIGHAKSLIAAACEHGLDNSETMRAAYLQQAAKWTGRAWKKASAFDRNFLSDARADKNRIELVRKLTAAQHRKIRESEAFHLKLVEESQML